MQAVRTASTHTNNKPVTSFLTDPHNVEIIEALRYDNLTLRDLAEAAHTDRGSMYERLKLLMDAGAVREEYRGGAISYTVANPDISTAAHILYELWAREVRKMTSQPAVNL